MINKVFDEYVNKFNEAVPVYAFPDDWDNDKICEVLKECIKTGEPYNPKYNENNTY